MDEFASIENLGLIRQDQMTKTREGIYEEIENHNCLNKSLQIINYNILIKLFFIINLFFKRALADMAAIGLIRSQKS